MENVVNMNHMMMVNGEGRKGSGGGSSTSDVNNEGRSRYSSYTTNNNKKKKKKKKLKGVRMRKWGRWVAEIRQPNSRQRIWLGSYNTEEEAGRAYDAAVFCLRGPDAMLNFPEDPPPPPPVPVPEVDIINPPGNGNGNGILMLPSQIQLAATKHARNYIYNNNNLKKDDDDDQIHDHDDDEITTTTTSNIINTTADHDHDDGSLVLQEDQYHPILPLPHEQEVMCFGGRDLSTADYYVAASSSSDIDHVTNILIDQGNDTSLSDETFYDPLLWSF